MGLIPGKKDPLEKEMATLSRIFSWETPWAEEPGGLQSTELQRAGLESVTEQQQQQKQCNTMDQKLRCFT